MTSRLQTVRFVSLTDLFSGVTVEYNWFYDSQMTWGDATHTLYPVSRLKEVVEDVIFDCDADDDADDIFIANEMIKAMDGYSPETLVDMEN